MIHAQKHWFPSTSEGAVSTSNWGQSNSQLLQPSCSGSFTLMWSSTTWITRTNPRTFSKKTISVEPALCTMYILILLLHVSCYRGLHFNPQRNPNEPSSKSSDSWLHLSHIFKASPHLGTVLVRQHFRVVVEARVGLTWEPSCIQRYGFLQVGHWLPEDVPSIPEVRKLEAGITCKIMIKKRVSAI